MKKALANRSAGNDPVADRLLAHLGTIGAMPTPRTQ